METFEAISKRASLKKCVSSREVEKEKISKVLEAARLAPSGRNMQPWRFIVITDRKLIQDLVSTAFNESNLVIKDAPVIIVVCANPADALTTGGREYYLFDAGLAVENMLLAATDMGLATNPMTGVNEIELKKKLGIPGEVRFVAATPLAYPAGDCYDEAAREKLGQRTRKNLKELAFTNKWEQLF